MSSTAIKQLLQNNRIWQASEKARSRPSLSTGYNALDQQLHYSGWPQGALSELLLPHHGVGEIRLLAPLMAKLSAQSGYICWINPPYHPYAPALINLQIDISKLITIQTNTDQETVWAAQQAMNSKACSAVLTWLPQKTLAKEVRKLSLSAESSQCWGVLLRHQSLQNQASSAALRLQLERQGTQYQANIIKQPGGWSGQKVRLNLFPERIYWNAQPVSEWPVFIPEKNETEKNNREQLQTTDLVTPSLKQRVDDISQKELAANSSFDSNANSIANSNSAYH